MPRRLRKPYRKTKPIVCERVDESMSAPQWEQFLDMVSAWVLQECREMSCDSSKSTRDEKRARREPG
jgi:hypothetical protein